MKARRIIYSDLAESQLEELYSYVASNSGVGRADAYVGQIMDYCESFRDFPERGTKRDDLRPGMRTIGFHRRVLIGFAVHRDSVVIHGIFYGGQDFEAALRDED
jgi:toxin ParE1/3/4